MISRALTRRLQLIESRRKTLFRSSRRSYRFPSRRVSLPLLDPLQDFDLLGTWRYLYVSGFPGDLTGERAADEQSRYAGVCLLHVGAYIDATSARVEILRYHHYQAQGYQSLLALASGKVSFEV